MGCTVRELQARMDSAEFTEWQAFDALEPIGERRADLRMALLCQLIANINRDPKRAAYSINDFLLFREPAVPADPEEVDANLRLIFEPLSK